MIQKLDLGCGSRKLPGFIRVDWNDDVKPDHTYDIAFDSPFDDSIWDVVVCDHVIEHIVEIDNMLSEVVRISKSGAKFRFSFPDFRVASIEPDHRGRWGLHCLAFHPQYHITGIDMEWSPGIGSRKGKGMFYRFINQVLSCLARSNPYFCERVWSSWVGGFSNITLQGVIKK